MYDLKCKRMDCEYNKNCNCTVDDLKIASDTSCNSYQKSNEAEVGEVERVIEQPAIRKDTDVACKADCLFNKDYSCEANGITVQTCDNKYCPNCCTYMPK